MTLVIAHRGASHAEPENTLAAFRRAGRMGADAVELDVRRTADDRLVVHHDPVLADGRPICDVPADRLPSGVPVLADALDACAGMFVNIEIKNDPSDADFDPTDRVAHLTVAELAPRGTDRRWLISSFRLPTVDVCHRLLPNARTAWLVTELSEGAIERTVNAGHLAIHPEVGSVTTELVRVAHAAGLAVNVWTCDDPHRIGELIGWGVDGICTNEPGLALAVRAGSSG
jgi:glycerophosphoryl diester phosphodiesterase